MDGPPALPVRRIAVEELMNRRLSARSRKYSDASSYRSYSNAAKPFLASAQYQNSLSHLEVRNKAIEQRDGSLRAEGQKYCLELVSDFNKMKMEMKTPETSFPESNEDFLDWDYWSALMYDYAALMKVSPAEIESGVFSGVPVALRRFLWLKFLEAKLPSLETQFNDLIASRTDSEFTDRIRADADRILGVAQWPEDSVDVAAVADVMYALYTDSEDQEKYSASALFVVIPISAVLTPQETFATVKCLLEYPLFCNVIFPTQGSAGHAIDELTWQAARILESAHPEVFAAISACGVTPQQWAALPLGTFFAAQLPLSAVLRVFDLVLFLGPSSLLRVLIGALLRSQDSIVSAARENPSELLRILRKDLFAVYENESGFREDDLFLDAIVIEAFPVVLDKFGKEFRIVRNREKLPNSELAEEKKVQESLVEAINKSASEVDVITAEQEQMKADIEKDKSITSELREKKAALLREMEQLKFDISELDMEEEIKYAKERNAEMKGVNIDLQNQLDLVKADIEEMRAKLAEVRQ